MTLLMMLFWLLGLILGWRLRSIAEQLRNQREARETFERPEPQREAI